MIPLHYLYILLRREDGNNKLKLYKKVCFTSIEDNNFHSMQSLAEVCIANVKSGIDPCQMSKAASMVTVKSGIHSNCQKWYPRQLSKLISKAIASKKKGPTMKLKLWKLATCTHFSFLRKVPDTHNSIHILMTLLTVWY